MELHHIAKSTTSLKHLFPRRPLVWRHVNAGGDAAPEDTRPLEGLEAAYYLARNHAVINAAVLERGWIGGGTIGVSVGDRASEHRWPPRTPVRLNRKSSAPRLGRSCRSPGRLAPLLPRALGARQIRRRQ